MGGVVNSWVMKGLFMSRDSGGASCEAADVVRLGQQLRQTITATVERCQSAGFSPCALSSHTHQSAMKNSHPPHMMGEPN